MNNLKPSRQPPSRPVLPFITLILIAFAIALCGNQPANSKDVVSELNASRSGSKLETTISDIFAQVDIPVQRSNTNQTDCNFSNSDSPIVFRNARYRSIYGHKARIEFRLVLDDVCYLIETKRQNVPGSVDEKLAFVYLNALHNLKTHRFVLIMDGHGWKPTARKWIEDKARETEGFDVLSVEGFKIWLSLQLK